MVKKKNKAICQAKTRSGSYCTTPALDFDSFCLSHRTSKDRNINRQQYLKENYKLIEQLWLMATTEVIVNE